MKFNRRTKRAFVVLLSFVTLVFSVLSGVPLGQPAAKAEGQSLRFDFGTATSAVMAGYKQVHNNLLYTPELGYGLSVPTNSRDRSGGNELTNDFLIPGAVNPYALIVDLPNGEYEVTVYAGDLLAGTSTTRTSVTIEGELKGTIQSRQAVNIGTYRTVVTDGQMNIEFGNNAYTNGVDITPVVPEAPAAPTGLQVTGISLADPPSVTLQWNTVTGAVYYDLYRSLAGEGASLPIARVEAPLYTDTAVVVGTSYEYHVTSINTAGLVSEASSPILAQVVQASNPPAAPALAVTKVEAGSVSLEWSSSEGATGYRIYRTADAQGEYMEIASLGAGDFTYTDSTADTANIQYYQVKAYNAAGLSEASNTAVSTIYQPPAPLPDGDSYHFDFGSGQVAEGYLQVLADTAYTPALKYGFTDPSKVTSVDRGTGDPLRSDLVSPNGTQFVVDLPNGDYAVTLVSGDAGAATQTAVKVESIQKVQQTDKPAGDYLVINFEIALVDGKLNLEFSGSAPAINSLVITRKPAKEAGEIPTVYLAGDSTVQTYDEYWKPEAGWGQMIPRFFTEQVVFKNHAIGGRSSKTFITEGRLDAVLREMKPGDYFFIQFGHNDATISVPERYASVPDYKEYLKVYITGARQRGATPVLVTPVGRRSFNAETGKFNISFPEYVQGMKEVAADLEVALVDLSTLSVAYYDSIGPEATKSVFLHTEPGIYGAWPNGSTDDTHFQEYGAIQIARLLSGGIKELGLPISAFVKDADLPEQVPAKPTGLVAGSISNAGAVLRWNAVETAEIYKIFRKLSTESTYKLVGTATVPTISVGGMAEGSTYELYVVAVNGRGESEPSDIVTVRTKAAGLKFDFGSTQNGGPSPVQEGYTEVGLSTLYTPERGYGIKNNAGMIARDRGTGTNLTRDWLGYFNAGWEFMVDLPNGAYAVKVYIGDMSGTGTTSVTIEGTGYGNVSGRNSVSERVFNNVMVKDGQLNIFFGGATGIANGLEITPILQAPSGLKVVEMNLELDQPTVKLSWNAAEDAAQYRVYRQSAGARQPELLGSTSELTFTDSTVDVGMVYTYSVTTVDVSGYETVGSMPVTLSTIDPNKQAPAAPTGLTYGAVNKKDLTLTWNAVADTKSYNIYRSKKAGGPFELIGKTKTTSYTDHTVLTTIPYYYQVAAVNAGGISDPSALLETPAVTTLVRQMEWLDRAPVAVGSENGIYIGWKMLGTDPDSIAFNVYRDGVKINTNPITTSTNYVDAAGKTDSVYQIKAIVNGVEKAVTSTFGVWQQSYMSVPLQKPADDVTKDGQPYTYSAGDASVGDLDGDGTYEIVMLWNPSNSKDNSQSGYTGIVYMDAYKLDGTRLWRINLGPNIRAGAHYTQFMVYDLDGDGKAEVAFKTADGTIDGVGQVIGNPDADYRNSGGYVLLGNEYLTVFEGLTGKALATVDYIPPRGDVALWGDGYGNRVDRFLAAIAYLDGERPSLIMSRGYYTRTVIAAFNFRDGELTNVWTFDTNDDGLGDYAGQGNHNLSVGDSDGDGKDEIQFGAMAVDDDGKPLYNTRLGHGDAMHFSDLDPSRPGLEVFDVHEVPSAQYGMELRDAATGEIIWGIFTGVDTGRGMAADIDPNHLGAEFWSANITNAQQVQVTGLHNAKGEMISTNIPSSTNFGIWWDGDLLRELLDGTRIDKWDYVNQTTVNLFRPEGVASNNGTKANPMLQADLFGDWREEVIWRSSDSSEMRIYTTTIPTEHRLRTLMHDPIYRLGIAWQNVSYNQPPHTSYYLGHGMTPPPAPSIYLVGQPTAGTATEATLSAPAQLRKGQSFETVFGLANVQQGGAAAEVNAVYAQDLTFTFDHTAVEFVAAESLVNGVEVLDSVVKDGSVRLILFSKGQEGAIRNDGAILKLSWRVKADTSSESASILAAKVVLSNGDGITREAQGTEQLIVVSPVSSGVLLTAIEQARAQYNAVTEGSGLDQVYPGSKARLLEALIAAQLVADDMDATEEELQEAVEVLAAARKALTAATGDVNFDSRITIGDLGILAGLYDLNSTDASWSSIAYADFNGDGRIGLPELVYVARKILAQ